MNWEKRLSEVGPWWSKTWWGRRHTAVNVTFVVVMLLYMLWKSLR
jgi:hypothetical protein